MFRYVGAIIIPQATGLTTPVLALFGMLANALPVTPGGLGVGEAAFDRLFNLAGFTGGASMLLGWALWHAAAVCRRVSVLCHGCEPIGFDKENNSQLVCPMAPRQGEIRRD